MKFKREDLINALSGDTGYYKKSTRKFVDSLSDTIVDLLSRAELGEDVKIEIAKGCWLCAKRVPEREAFDPRNSSVLITPEKNLPYAKFTVTFKQKINERGA